VTDDEEPPGGTLGDPDAEGRRPTSLRVRLGELRDLIARLWSWQHAHRWDRRLAILVLALAGATVAVALFGTVHQSIGPVRADLALRPSFAGGTEIDVPPVGKLTMDSHWGPLQIRASITGIRLDQARDALGGGLTGPQLENQISQDVRQGLLLLSLKSAAAALLGACIVVALAFRRWRPVAAAAVTTVLALVVGGGITAVTWNTKALAQPRFTGLLASAPALIGDIQDIRQRFNSYRAELAKIVTNVAKLYDVASTLPGAPPSDAIAVLWVSDIHDNPEAFDVMESLISQFGVKAVVDTGDISDHGTSVENALYASVSQIAVPYIYIRGNHDSRTATQAYLASLRNVRVLDDGRIADVAGIRWAGIGDPRFTPDKQTTNESDSPAANEALTDAGEELATAVRAADPPVDVALVHEPTMAEPLAGTVPLVLDGHIHERAYHRLADSTLELTQGSSGGAGLRTLDGGKALPLESSILYFSSTTHRLLAVDDVTVSGLGLESVTIQRHSASYYAKLPEPEPSTS
jgi:predicted phosphodiesterase